MNPLETSETDWIIEMATAMIGLMTVMEYAKFDNGVTDPTGTCNEAEYWASNARQRAEQALLAYNAKMGFVPQESAPYRPDLWYDEHDHFTADGEIPF